MGAGLGRAERTQGKGPRSGLAGLAFGELLLLLLLLAGAVYGLIQWRPWERWGRQVYLVPIGTFSADSLDRLVASCKGKFRVGFRILPPISVGPEAYDFQRRQFVAEDLITTMKRELTEQVEDGKAILIGITGSDMYSHAKPEWHFAFAGIEMPRFAVVSTARMDPVNLGGKPNEALLDERLRKVVFRSIGHLYYKLPPSPRPRSLMYESILNVDDLDDVSEDF